MPFQKLMPMQKAGASFSFEPVKDETQDEYHVFAQFLESDPMQSPARWLMSRDLDVATWWEIAERNSWISRRIDYWNYAAIRQRVVWVNMLTQYSVDIMSRRQQQIDRLEQARAAETEISVILDKRGNSHEVKGILGREYNDAIKSFNMDVQMITMVIGALNGVGGSITIINNAVGTVALSKDTRDIAASWDRISQNIIEGTATQRAKSLPDSE